ncbi:MAG TPA: glycosyltransferase family 2 protein [Thermoleophilaceae bacterium]
MSAVVHAVLVTFNRKELLMECLDGVFAQTHAVERVLLVDNASSDGTPELLRERGFMDREELDYVRLPENLGSSGGFAEAVRVARDADCDWLWLMDDDSSATPEALATLLRSAPAADANTVALCPKVVYANGELDRNQRGRFRRRLIPLPEAAYVPGTTPELDFLSFVGALVRTRAARAEDPPKAEFFVWGDDVEYSFRLRRQGRILLVPDAVMVHKRVSQSHMNGRARFWNRVLPVSLFPTPLERFWQNLCGLRNYIWMKREYEGQSALSAAGTTAQFMAKHLLYDEQPLRRLKWILRFARDGRRGRFENIPPERWAEMVRRDEI